MSLRQRLLPVLLAVLVGGGASALDLGSRDDLWSIEVHGFASQGFIYTTGNNYLAYSKDGSFEFTEVGLNVTKQLTDDLRFGAQIFSRKLGPTGNYSAKMDWYDVDWHPRDWFGLRAGRVKIPFGLYNDTSDTDAARVPVLLPSSVYPAEARDYLLAQTGGELYGFINLQAAGALDYNLYGGTIFIDTSESKIVGATVLSSRVPYIVGGRLLWETPLPGLRVGASAQLLSVDYDILFPLPAPIGDTEVKVRLPIQMWIASAEYVHRDLLLAAEFSRWYVASTNSSNTAIFPDLPTLTDERAYVMASYRVKRWFTPGAYYAVLFANIQDRKGLANVQHDLSGTARFDINAFWLVKLEAHYMIGTAAVDPGLNDNLPATELPGHWWAFFVKTTAHF